MRLFLLFILLAHLFLLSSCKKYQPADSSFFIKSEQEKITVSTTSRDGSGSHKITDLWLYVNGKYQGTYPNGSLMPVVSQGKGVKINVFAGIKNNGISDTRIPYPFFDFLTLDTLVESGKTVTRGFVFKYKAATTFTWMENFENTVGTSIVNDGFDGVLDKAQPEDCFEGKSLRFTLPAGGTAARMVSTGDGFILPTSSGNVYLEIDYKCDTDFIVGLIGSDGIEIPAITIKKQLSWNKIYIQFSVAASSLATLKSNVYFKILKDSNGQTKQIFLDNIKLLYL